MEHSDQSGLKPPETENDSNEEIIDLTESLVPDPAADGDHPDVEARHGENTTDEETIIDLQEVAGTPSDTSDDEIIDLVEQASPHDDTEELIDLTDVAQPLDDAGQAEAPQTFVNISQEQIEAALERVMEKMFSEKIEKMMYDAAEIAVSKEIQKIRSALLDDSQE